MLLIIGLVLLFHLIHGKSIHKIEQHSEWQEYKVEFGLNFSEHEESEFRSNFYENLRFINEHNSKNGAFCVALNKLAHLKNPNQHGCVIMIDDQLMSKVNKSSLVFPNRPYPISMDWRINGHVSPVKDQFMCGSCYAFGTTASIESHVSIHHGKKAVSFSEQEIVDCAGDFNTGGCMGGSPYGVFQYVMAKGISVQDEYPYRSFHGRCKRHKTKHRYTIDDVKVIPFEDEEALVKAIAFFGPVAISINGNHLSFAFYRSGVYRNDNCDTKKLTHNVLAVGYHLGDDPYIIIKNSWNTWWGEGGYGKIALFRKNQCGIVTHAMYPVIKK